MLGLDSLLRNATSGALVMSLFNTHACSHEADLNLGQGPGVVILAVLPGLC